MVRRVQAKMRAKKELRDRFGNVTMNSARTSSAVKANGATRLPPIISASKVPQEQSIDAFLKELKDDAMLEEKE